MRQGSTDLCTLKYLETSRRLKLSPPDLPSESFIGYASSMAGADGGSGKELPASDWRTAPPEWPRYTGTRPTGLGERSSR